MYASRRCATLAISIRKNVFRWNFNPTWTGKTCCRGYGVTTTTSANPHLISFRRNQVMVVSSFARRTLAAVSATGEQDESGNIFRGAATVAVWAMTLATLGSLWSISSHDITLTFCESFTPASVNEEDFEAVKASHDVESMPIYTSDQVAKNDGTEGKPIWVTYGGVVYDITEFIANHPGGSEKIMTAAGSAVEPFWFLYRQHFASDLPMKLLEHMAIGRLDEKDQDAIDEQMANLYSVDPYAKEPERHSLLKIHSDTPMNAETPTRLLTNSYLTPTSLFYIRHHHPVPYLTEKEIKRYQLQIDLTEYGKGIVSFSLDDIKKMNKVEVVATLQCSGNRRSGFNSYKRTSGTPWGQGAISTAKFGGVRLLDLLKVAGLEDPIEAQEKKGIEHIQFHALDGMMASIGIEKAANPYGDVIVCYEMNDEPLPRDHGFPLRVIVPGYAAVRNVKWLKKIVPSANEAEGDWQRGLNYKILPPSIGDAGKVDLAQMPSVMEVSLFSGITHIEPISSGKPHPGDRIQVRVGGWAWSGGGRNIVRVDVTADEGRTWATAKLKEGANQRFGRAWAWVFWECIVEAIVSESGNIHLASKAVDMAFNSQPDTPEHGWNVRGLANNSWYKVQASVV